MTTQNQFIKKIKISGNLIFDTAFHIGSGKEGEMSSDMGVMLDPDGTPLLPGSTLKGSFRTFAERLACHLDMNSCLLDSELSGFDCVSDEAYRRSVHDEFKALVSEKKKLEWLDHHTCSVCQLFGSPLKASRIFFSDGVLIQGGESITIRDGVCIDRDSETARPKAKFDYEVIPMGAVFSTVIEIENPESKELALIAAALGEWENGFRLGGFKSRGLGLVRFTERSVRSVDYSDTTQLLNYLVSKQMQPANDLLEKHLKKALNA